MSLTEPVRPGAFILTESPGTLSRDTVSVTVPAATTLAPGTVLGQLSGLGTYVPYDEAESDGREAAAGILYGPLANDTDGPVTVTGVIVNWGAEVRADALIWGNGVDEAGGLADLAALGIKARE